MTVETNKQVSNVERTKKRCGQLPASGQSILQLLTDRRGFFKDYCVIELNEFNIEVW